MSNPPKAVFLSYASQDADAARRIAEALRAIGVEVWFDQAELRGGDAWDQKIRQQIKACALFVPIISANTEARLEGYFRREWRMAVERMHDMDDDMPFLVPLVIDDTGDAEARVPERFRERQWTRLPAGSAAGFTERVQRLLTGSSPSPGAPATPRAPGVAPAAEEKSVAVLAFANLSNDPENEFFSDGISEELINVLVRMRDMKVSARTSAFHFKGRHTPVREIARQLGVAYVVEGSVRKAGERVRITAQLSKAADGFHVWSDIFTRELKDVFAVQEEIAGLIAQQLQLRLRAEGRTNRPVNPEAVQLYLRGRHFLNQNSLEGFRHATERLQEAVGIDPSFAPAWAALSHAAAHRGGFCETRAEFDASFRLAREAAGRALALDAGLATTHLALARIQSWQDHDWKGVRDSLQRARALAPADVDVIHHLADMHLTFGHVEQAVDLGRQTVALDPVNPAMRMKLGYMLGVAGKFAEAEIELRRMIELNPAASWGHGGVGLIYVLQGRFAAAEAEAALEVPEFSRLYVTALAQWGQGNQAGADDALARLTQRHAETAVSQIAGVHAFRGDADQAFAWLERAYELRDPGVAWFKTDPLFHRLHDDPRWGAFLRKLGLADDQLP